MATKDVATELMTTIWNLLNADNNWQIDPDNEVRYDQVIGTQDPDRQIVDDGDYPRARLWMSSGKSGMFTSDQTFATLAAEGPPSHVEKMQFTFQLEIISQLIGVNEIDQEYLEAIQALRNGGPKLGGLDYVTRCVAAWKNEQVGIDVNSTDTTRWKATITLTIDCELDSAELGSPC